MVGADGRGVHKVTRGRAYVAESDPDWSPDGGRIVFDRSFSCPDPLTLCTAIWVVNADGSGERRLTPQTPGIGELSPTWSPDGRRIAYVRSDDRSETSDLYLMNADGSAKRRLTHVRDAEEPAWSPDGKRIALSHDGDIFVLDLDSGSLQRLTKTPLIESYPDWSPDGKRIAYELNNPTPPGRDVQEYDAFVMDADGTHQRRLSRRRDTDGHPVWSRGGELIAYTSDAGPLLGDSIAIVIVEADTGDFVRRIRPPGIDLYPIDWTGG